VGSECDPREGFLEPEQFEKLLAAIPENLHPLVRFLLPHWLSAGGREKD